MGLYILMMGVQGAGKGTQAKFLAEKFGIPHISTGDMFRAMKNLDTPLAQEVQALMKKGELISDEVTNRVVEDRLSHADAQEGVILDGYPRSVGQAETLDQMLAERDEQVSVTVVLELDREIGIKRAEGRRFSQDKQRTYNIYFLPPKHKVDGEWVDDVDGQPLIQREDDVWEAVERRIDLYLEQTAPLIDYYEQQGKVVRVNANQTIDQVTQDIIAAIESVQ